MPIETLDQIDRSILAAVQADGRISNQALSEKVGLSPSPCLRRLRHLESVGLITGYVALIDPERLGLGVTAFIQIRLDQQGDRHLTMFEQTITDFPEVMECYLMTGSSDYQMRVVVEDLKAFEDFLRHKLTRVPGVSQITTSFALRSAVYRTALPM